MNLNTKLIHKIIKAIKAHPQQFQMTYLFWGYLDTRDRYGNCKPAGGCGTAGCIAGWAIHLSSRRKKLRSSQAWANGIDGGLLEVADRLLGYKYNDVHDDHPLFYVRGWPEDLKQEYYDAKTARQQAAVAVKRLEHLLKHGV